MERIFLGLKQNLGPAIVLWIFGASLVTTYYLVDETRPWFSKVIEIKQANGYLYSAISTSFFGGLIPFLFMRITGRDRVGNFWIHGFIFLGYWGARGVDVDAFYRFQSWVFGDEPDVKTILLKVSVDQFIYCVLWATPVTAVFYKWKEFNFSIAPWAEKKTWVELFDIMVVFMVSTWMVWIPATAIVYSLPEPLQIPLFNLTLCFFVILVSVFAGKVK